MEFKEFTNPGERDYDITSSLPGAGGSANLPVQSNPYEDELLELVGFLSEEQIKEYGLSVQEYLHPTAQTVAKVRAQLAPSESVQRLP